MQHSTQLRICIGVFLRSANRITALRMASTGKLPLDGKVALVTGASRGIGRGIALQLGEAGANVFVTGREPSKSGSKTNADFPTLEKVVKEIGDRGGKATAVYCDHSDAKDVEKLFQKISEEANGRLDVLVNNAFSGAQAIKDNGGKKFYECDPLLWDDINKVGLRNVYVCAVHAARLMVPKKSGLIVNISSAGGLQYFFNVPYGVGKAAIDRMSADIAVELKPSNVCCVSLWPGTVRTEMTLELLKKGELSRVTGMSEGLARRSVENGETPEFVGRAVVALANDPKVMKKSGHILLTGDLCSEYGFTDIDGKIPQNIRSVSAALDFFGWSTLASVVPSFIKVPSIGLHISTNKF